jgi:dihydroorotate dehydrogenase electron transfer subunit
MKQMQAQVLENNQVADNIRLLRFRAADIAATATAGQFVQVRTSNTWDPLLRRPISIHRMGDSGRGADFADEIALLYQVVGRGTELLGELRTGDKLDVMGPLGNGFKLKSATRRLLLVGGGLGVAPLVAAADAALQQDVEVTLIAGARNADNLLPATYLPAEVEYIVATEDGSAGQHGFVTAVLPSYLAWPDQIFVCGPRPMAAAIANMAAGRRDKVQVSLEEHMACGVGACLGCAVETKDGLRSVCHDGPVFELSKLRF